MAVFVVHDGLIVIVVFDVAVLLLLWLLLPMMTSLVLSLLPVKFNMITTTPVIASSDCKCCYELLLQLFLSLSTI